MDDLSREFNWIGFCVKKIDVTNIGSQHDLTDLLTPVGEIEIDEVDLIMEDDK